MAANIQRYFSATATQGSNDAFVQTTISTDLDPRDGLGFQINRVEVLRAAGMPFASSDISFSITRDTKTAVAKLDDDDCLLSDMWRVSLSTSGVFIDNQLKVYDFNSGLFIVEPIIYIQLDSTGTSATNAAYFRLYYEQVKLTEVEILRLLNNI